jgi:tetrahydromethanopterin S-methyltransferase subunit G
MFEENKESFRYKTEKRIESLETAVQSIQLQTDREYIKNKLDEIEIKLDSVLSEFANVVGCYVDGLNQLHERIGKIEEYIKQTK